MFLDTFAANITRFMGIRIRNSCSRLRHCLPLNNGPVLHHLHFARVKNNIHEFMQVSQNKQEKQNLIGAQKR